MKIINFPNRFLILFVFLLFIAQLSAQELKYKRDVFPKLVSLSNEDAYSLLSVHYWQNTSHANTCYQLGLLCKKWLLTSNPITNYNDVKYYYSEAKKYFDAAKTLTDEKEAKKNDEFYPQVKRLTTPDKLMASDIIADIDQNVSEIATYYNSAVSIYSLFNSAQNNYVKCIARFKEISEQYAHLEEIYLLADNDFLQQLNEINTFFDSCRISLDNYLNQVQNPPFQTGQKVEFQPIKNYRIDGINYTDFSEKEIILWDFGTWVKNFTDRYHSDIKALRDSIEFCNKSYFESIEYLRKTKEFDDNTKYYQNIESIVNLIGKYDFESIIFPLFHYQKSKANFLSQTHYIFNNIDDNQHVYPFQKRAEMYYHLLKSKLLTDSLSDEFSKFISTEQVKKYQDFFNNNFGNIEGIIKFNQTENAENQKFLDNSFTNLLFFLDVETKLFTQKNAIVNYKNTNIPLFTTIPEFTNLQNDQYYTTALQEDNNSNLYFTGYFKPAGKNTRAFVGKLNKNLAVEWLKTFKIKLDTTAEFNDCGMLLQITGNNCFVVINSSTEDGQMVNSLIHLNAKGEEVSISKLEADMVPRQIIIDDVNQKLLLAFKGKKFDPYTTDVGKLALYYTDTLGVAAWSQTIKFEGNLVNIVKMNQRYLIFCNFSIFINSKNAMIVSKAGKNKTDTNLLTITLNDKGVVQDMKATFSEKPFFVASAIKINSEIVNLIGIRSPLLDVKKTDVTQLGTIYYALFDEKGDEKFSNK